MVRCPSDLYRSQVVNPILLEFLLKEDEEVELLIHQLELQLAHFEVCVLYNEEAYGNLTSAKDMMRMMAADIWTHVII